MKKRATLLAAGGIANMFEWYDYALFGHLAMVIGAKFFNTSSQTSSVLEAFMVFAMGYLMRPLGGLLFGIIGDKLGRKTSLSLSVACMSLPTIFIGLMPTYDAIGQWATWLMVMARMLQGLSMGGALAGSIAFNIEHTQPCHRGFIGSLSMAGICLGILLGALVCYTVRICLSEQNFDAWGWRLPFIMGFLILAVSVYIKRYVAETPEFEQNRASGNLHKSPLGRTFKGHWFDMLVSIMINATGSVIFYMCAVFSLSFFKARGLGDDQVTLISSFCYLVMTFTTLMAGWLSDKVSRKTVLAVTALVVMILAPIIVNAFESGSMLALIVSQALLSLLAAMYIGPEPALQAEFYPANIRSTALSLSYNTAVSIFGGTTPYFMMSVFEKTHSLDQCMWYIEFCAVLSLLGLFLYKVRSERMQQL